MRSNAFPGTAAFAPRPCTEAAVTFREASRQWITRQKITVKESTAATYNTILKKQLLPDVGDMVLPQFTVDFLNQYVLQKIKSGLSSKYVRDIMTILRAVLGFAGQFYGCFIPYRLSALPRLDNPDSKILCDPERRRLEDLTFLSADYRQQGIFLCLYTGLRIGELCALRWSDFSAAKDVLRIQRTLQRIPNLSEDGARTKVIVTEPKTSRSARDIPLPSFLSEHLRSIARGLPPDAFFLTGRSDHCMEPRSYQDFFLRFLRRNNFEPINFHALRHTFATRCINEGFDPKSLSEILGHASVEITLNRYVHTGLDTKRKYMELLVMQ